MVYLHLNGVEKLILRIYLANTDETINLKACPLVECPPLLLF